MHELTVDYKTKFHKLQLHNSPLPKASNLIKTIIPRMFQLNTCFDYFLFLTKKSKIFGHTSRLRSFHSSLSIHVAVYLYLAWRSWGSGAEKNDQGRVGQRHLIVFVLVEGNKWPVQGCVEWMANLDFLEAVLGERVIIGNNVGAHCAGSRSVPNRVILQFCTHIS